jgi:hypothetical protein
MASGAGLFAWLGPRDGATSTGAPSPLPETSEPPIFRRELCNDALSRRRALFEQNPGVAKAAPGSSKEELEGVLGKNLEFTLLLKTYFSILEDIQRYCGQ